LLGALLRSWPEVRGSLARLDRAGGAADVVPRDAGDSQDRERLQPDGQNVPREIRSGKFAIEPFDGGSFGRSAERASGSEEGVHERRERRGKEEAQRLDLADHHGAVPQALAGLKRARRLRRRFLDEPADPVEVEPPAERRCGRLDPAKFGLGAVGNDSQKNDDVFVHVDEPERRRRVRHECRVVGHPMIRRKNDDRTSSLSRGDAQEPVEDRHRVPRFSGWMTSEEAGRPATISR
jgi:hypothetical protein